VTAAVTIRVPALIASVCGGRRVHDASGASIGEALADLAAREPALANHLFDEAGVLRRNIMLIHNEDYIRTRDAQTRILRPGDAISVMNRVSGG
jgi:molybdopterin converting factor small subunit